MIALYREIRQLWPVTAVWLLALVLDLIARAFTERLDEQTFQSICMGLCDEGADLTALVWIGGFALAFAYSLLPREYDEGTIDYLRSLPLSFRSLYYTKVLAAMLILLVLLCLDALVTQAVLWLNPQSMDGVFYGTIAWQLSLRNAVLAFVVLSHGMLLSWFRLPGLLIYLLCYWLPVLLLAQSGHGLPEWVDYRSILENRWDGQQLSIASAPLLWHTAIALLCNEIALRLWSRTPASVHAGDTLASRWRHRGRWLAAGMAPLVLFVVAMLAMLVFIGRGLDDGAASIARISTRHFTLSYRAAAEDAALELAAAADDDYRAQRELFGFDSEPRIQADMTAARDHVAGLAMWTRISMELDPHRDLDWHRHVLNHETAHVFQSTESGGSHLERFAEHRFFIEGMAEVVAHAIVPDARGHREGREIAAVSVDRHALRFADLLDAERFARDYDVGLFYTVGESWVDALIEICGTRAPVAVLREMPAMLASPLAGERYWQALLQRAGCNSVAVNARWRQLLDAVLDDTVQARFPRFGPIELSALDSGGVLLKSRLLSGDGDQRALADRPDHLRFSVQLDARARSGGLPRSLPAATEQDEDGVWVRVRIPSGFLGEETLRVRMGYSAGESNWQFVDVARELRLP